MKKRPHNKVLPKAGLNGFDWAFEQGSIPVDRDSSIESRMLSGC